jgi:hypothetical protein
MANVRMRTCWEYPTSGLFNPTGQCRCLVFYFEVTVRNAGRDGYIAIGFSDKDFDLNRHPGWDPNSYGYHGDDGLMYPESDAIVARGPTFTTDDAAGAGVHLGRGEIFFTRNGVPVGTAFRSVNTSQPMYPAHGRFAQP